jgi:hypothetical protein
MNPRDVEAQPGDNDQTELEGESLERGAEPKPLVMPQKADVTKSDQARRRPTNATTPKATTPKATRGASTPAARLFAPLRRTAGTIRPASQVRPVSEPTRSERIERDVEPAAARVRLGSPHPLSRLRLQDRGRSLGRSLAWADWPFPRGAHLEPATAGLDARRVPDAPACAPSSALQV